MSDRLYVGIDAGGTGTRSALVAADGTLLATGRGGPSGSSGGAAGLGLVRRAFDTALSPLAEVVGSRQCSVHVGLRGLSIAGRREAAVDVVSRHLPGARVTVSNDAAIALEGGLAGAREGLVVLAGTGSIALARRADGTEVRTGGFGYLLGDEGSGFWLGREAVAASLRHGEGRGRATLLTELLRSELRLATDADLIAWVYRARHPAPHLAALAPLVCRAAMDGDAVAVDLLRRAGEHLAELGITAALRTWPGSMPEPLLVARCGGVWSAGRPLIAPFDARLNTGLPKARSLPPRVPPLGGAVLLAMAADLSRPPSPALIEALSAIGVGND